MSWGGVALRNQKRLSDPLCVSDNRKPPNKNERIKSESFERAERIQELCNELQEIQTTSELWQLKPIILAARWLRQEDHSNIKAREHRVRRWDLVLKDTRKRTMAGSWTNYILKETLLHELEDFNNCTTNKF